MSQFPFDAPGPRAAVTLDTHLSETALPDGYVLQPWSVDYQGSLCSVSNRYRGRMPMRRLLHRSGWTWRYLVL